MADPSTPSRPSQAQSQPTVGQKDLDAEARRARKERVPEYLSEDERGQDDIAKQSEDSFPASDPPSFTPQRHEGQPRKPGKH